MSDYCPVVSIVVSFFVDNEETFFGTVLWDRRKSEFKSVDDYCVNLSHKFGLSNHCCRQIVGSIQQQLVRYIIQYPSLYNLKLDRCEDASEYFKLTKELFDQEYHYDPKHYDQIHISENSDNGKSCNYCHTYLQSRKVCKFCNLPRELPYNDIIHFYVDECFLCNRSTGKFCYCLYCPLRFHKDCIKQFHLSFVCPYCQMGCSFLRNKPKTLSNILLYILYRLTLFSDHAIFNIDIDEDIREEYYQEMTYPIYLQQVACRLIRGQYECLEQFLMDVRQIYRNCRVYNSEKSDIYNSSIQFQHVFEIMVWQWAFQIRPLPPF